MISGKHVRLWPLERHDLIKNYQWANSRDLIKLAGMHPVPKSVHDVERWYESTLGAGDLQIYAIKTPDGDYLGNIELRDIDLRCGKAEIGILIGEGQNQNKGYGTDAILALCRFAFRELRFHRICARVLDSNVRAQHTFKKLGFQPEGVERQSHFAGGRHHDVVVLSLLAGELKEVSSATD